FFAGKTTTLNLGGTGRRIVGKLAPAVGYSGRVIWNLNLLQLEGTLPPPPEPLTKAEDFKDPKRYETWRIAYEKYLQLQTDNTYFSASLGDDGAFHIDDVPPGNYDLRMW